MALPRRPAIRFAMGLAILGVMVWSALPASAGGSATRANYVGTDTNWFNPANWSTGQVPDAMTDVVLDQHDTVVISPSAGGPEVRIRDLLVTDQAVLTTLPGTIMRDRDETIGREAQVVYQATESSSDTLSMGPLGQRCVGCGMKLNPTPKSIRTIVLQSSLTLNPSAVAVSFGLGGADPASPGHVGAGHYATLVGDRVSLGGLLLVERFYGFSPSAGQRFKIVTVNGLRLGRFSNVGEGDRVARFEDGVGLYITYRGGDGNDVVLTAR
jgi:hypothetical protein